MRFICLWVIRRIAERGSHRNRSLLILSFFILVYAPVIITATTCSSWSLEQKKNTHSDETWNTKTQITLSALQGQPGSTLLLKNEQGQFQLLRIGPAPAGTQITPAGLTGSSANQTIRLQTVPAVSRFTGPPLALRKTIVTSAQQVKQKQNVITKSKPNLLVDHTLLLLLLLLRFFPFRLPFTGKLSLALVEFSFFVDRIVLCTCFFC